MNKLANFFRNIYQERFKRYLVISLIILGVILLFTGQEATSPVTDEGSEVTGQEETTPITDEETEITDQEETEATTDGRLEVHFFHFPSCSHCNEQKPFNEKLATKYPAIHLTNHDITTPRESDILSEMLADLGVDDNIGVPITIFGERVFHGWKSEKRTGEEIETALQEWLIAYFLETESETPEDEIVTHEDETETPEDEIVTSEDETETTEDDTTIPIIGKIRLSDYSLPGLAVILGLVDGFNPCAMWVLAYLISLIMTLNDRRKTWLLVGSFVFASGVLYFLFMTAWLNTFLIIGYFKPLTIIIGLIALGAGILNIREFIKTKGAIVCEVGGEESRKKTLTRIEKVVLSPLTLTTIVGIIALAFVVNSIEFVCSSALPAIFTHVLSLSNLSTLQYYAYILLYDCFFMLDDLVIFGAAAFAVTSGLGDRYAKYTKPVGGAILLSLGLLLLFAPDLLR